MNIAEQLQFQLDLYNKTAAKPPKQQFLLNFQVCGLLYHTQSPIRAKFGIKEWTHGVLYRAKFHIVSP